MHTIALCWNLGEITHHGCFKANIIWSPSALDRFQRSIFMTRSLELLRGPTSSLGALWASFGPFGPPFGPSGLLLLNVVVLLVVVVLLLLPVVVVLLLLLLLLLLVVVKFKTF